MINQVFLFVSVTVPEMKVTAVFDDALGLKPASSYNPSSSLSLVPALGLVWANCVNSRFMLEKTSLTREVDSSLNLPDSPKRARIDVRNHDFARVNM